MHSGNDKKLKYQAANKYQITVDPHSQPYTTLQRSSGHQAPKQKNPLLPTTTQPTVSSTQQLSTKSRVNSSSYQFCGRANDIDLPSADEPLEATDYVEDMYALFRKKEKMTAVLPIYMESTQSQINEKMRAILVDWLVEVHMKFKLVPETLFLTINLIDRYLERSEIARPNLQLLGVSCLMIASKYEEIYPPSVVDLVYICDNAYTKTNVSLPFTLALFSLIYFRLTLFSSFRLLLLDHQDGDTNPQDIGIPNYPTQRSYFPGSLLEGRTRNQGNYSTRMLLVGRNPFELLNA